MPNPQDVYINCDILENIPKLNRDNWLKEIDLLKNTLPQGANILQVGSMDASRAIFLFKERPDLQITGLEIEASLVELAKRNVAVSGLQADFVCGDITNPPVLSLFDYVICLNNTLGYIPEYDKAIKNMRKLGKTVIVSVYGEKFDNDLAREYFDSIKLEIDHIDGDKFVMKDFTTVKRFSKKEVESWSGEVIETPVGYFCILK